MSKFNRPHPSFKTVQVIPGGKALDCFFNEVSNTLFITLPMGEVGKSTAIYVERVSDAEQVKDVA